ncbi:telomere binding protein [Marasmius tenuissimus]|nr:telomere binding protein [Marasmius tenuissimus]
MRNRLAGAGSSAYALAWSRILQSFTSSSTLRAVFVSLFATLKGINSIDMDITTRALVRREARFLHEICPLHNENQELWECASSIIVHREWDEGRARIFVGWLSFCDRIHRNDKTLQLLLNDVLSQWTDPDHIKHSLLSRHRYLTLLLLLAISYLPMSALSSMASSNRFISAIGVYISHMDNSVRHYGMLAAEIVAQRAGKKLDFEDWVGEDSDKAWCRQVRQLIQTRDIDVDVQTVNVVEEVKGESNIPPGMCLPRMNPGKNQVNLHQNRLLY